MKESRSRTLNIIAILLGLALILWLPMYAYRSGKEDGTRHGTNQATQDAK